MKKTCLQGGDALDRFTRGMNCGADRWSIPIPFGYGDVLAKRCMLEEARRRTLVGVDDIYADVDEAMRRKRER